MTIHGHIQHREAAKAVAAAVFAGILATAFAFAVTLVLGAVFIGDGHSVLLGVAR